MSFLKPDAVTSGPHDMCSSCGKEHPVKLWPESCACGGIVVHVGACTLCHAPVGYVIDDDYQAPERLICPAHLGGKNGKGEEGKRDDGRSAHDGKR